MDVVCICKVCEQYMELMCFDDEMKLVVLVVFMMFQKIDYFCDGNNQFSIYYGIYIFGDQWIKLIVDDVVFFDC